MSLRKHRDKAIGKRNRNRRMPAPDEIKLGTKIKEDAEQYVEKAEQCSKCGDWFGSDDLENNFCYSCIKEINQHTFEEE